jgi:AcrR family transcriptional regulator
VVETSASTRTYRSTLRVQRAAQTRLRVIRAAADLFGRQGYRRTTFAQLAEQAGVSVETVRKHGSKSALLWAAIELSAFGVVGETDFFATDLGQAWLRIATPEELVTFTGEAFCSINGASAGLWTAVVSAAHDDPEVRTFRDQMLRSVRSQVEATLRVLDDRGWLRRDVDLDELVEGLCVVTSVESYVRFVLIDGRSEVAYKAFVARMFRESILSVT